MVDRNIAAIANAELSESLKSLFSRYESINHPVISDFISSIPAYFSDAADSVLRPSDNNSRNDIVLKNRAKLEQFIIKFHSEAKTMNTHLRHNLALLTDPETKILLSAHQPNLFAYAGVFKKIVLLQSLKDRIKKFDKKGKTINLFLIADHDFVDDLWIHYAELPSVRHSSGILELRLPLSNTDRRQMVRSMPLPERSVVECWRKQIDSWIRNFYSSSASHDNQLNVLGNFEHFWQQVELSYSKAKSYSDFNSFLMSQLVNEIWGYDTLFVRLTDMSAVFENGFKHLLSNFRTYSNALRQSEYLFLQHGINNGISIGSYVYAPIWLHCECGSKAPAKIHEKEYETMIIEGVCLGCNKSSQINLGNKYQLNLLKDDVIHRFSPRAIPLMLLFSNDLGITCYASGTAGVRYLIHGSLAFKALSIKMPLTLIWPSANNYYGIGQSEALQLVGLRQHSDVIAHLELLKRKDAEYASKTQSLTAERMKRVNAGEPIQTLLSDLCHIKEEHREIRRVIQLTNRAKYIMDMKPCFVDLAVNFGVMNTEIQWREHLSKYDNLAAPVVMTVGGK